MRIEQDIKLDYSDVLFKHKRSKLESRRDVDLLKNFLPTVPKNGQVFQYISNMDGVGSFKMAKHII